MYTGRDINVHIWRGVLREEEDDKGEKTRRNGRGKKGGRKVKPELEPPDPYKFGTYNTKDSLYQRKKFLTKG